MKFLWPSGRLGYSLVRGLRSLAIRSAQSLVVELHLSLDPLRMQSRTNVASQSMIDRERSIVIPTNDKTSLPLSICLNLLRSWHPRPHRRRHQTSDLGNAKARVLAVLRVSLGMSMSKVFGVVTRRGDNSAAS